MNSKEIIKSLSQKEKFLLIIPLLVLPFVSFAFWSLGGGSGKVGATGISKLQSGFNTDLPKANLKNEQLNKLQFYEQAEKDSARLKDLMKSDPYYKRNEALNALKAEDTALMVPRVKYGQGDYSSGLLHQKDANEEKVYAKIAQLNAQIEKSNMHDVSHLPQQGENTLPQSTVNTAEIDRLEGMMNIMKNETGNDPEMQQINSMLDKIMDIQNPDRAKERLQQQSGIQKTKVFPVSTRKQQPQVSLLQRHSSSVIDTSLKVAVNIASRHNRFFALDDTPQQVDEVGPSIQAVVDETQTIVSGAIVKFRLLDEVFIKGMLVPKGSLVYGIVNLAGERLETNINSIRYQNVLLPVSLSVYDMDGLSGIFVPGAITRDVAKQSADQAIQSLSLSSLDPSVGAQAASAGIQAAKTLIGKKAKLIKVTIKAGYKVLLKDNNNKS